MKTSASAVVVAILSAACGGSHKTHTTPAAISVPQSVTTKSVPSQTTIEPTKPRTDLESMFEDEGMLQHDPASAMATFKSLGVQTLRVYINWQLFAPNSASVDLTNSANYQAYYMNYLDKVDRAAAADHIRILLDAGAPAPTWAEGKHPRGTTGGWEPNATYYGDFMQALGSRYSGHYTPSGSPTPLPRISFWSIWNEPNGVYLLPNAVGSDQTLYAPKLYRALVNATFTGLAKSGHTTKTDTITIGETAPRGNSSPGLGFGIYPLIFIRALYCVSDSLKPLTGTAATDIGCPASGSVARFKAQNPGLFEASGFADHPYSDTEAPTVKTPTADGGANQADFAALGSLEATLDAIFKAYGSDRELPIYSTEYGYKTDPPTALGIPDKTAAAYDNETEYESWLNPRVDSFDQYLLIDPYNLAADDFDTGLEKANPPQGNTGTPKPYVYDAYLMPLWLPRTTGTAGQKLLVWGCARPVNDEGVSSATVDIQFAPGSSSAYSTVQTATVTPARGGCYFTAQVPFSHSGIVRLSYDDAGKTLISRPQAITIH